MCLCQLSIRVQNFTDTPKSLNFSLHVASVAGPESTRLLKVTCLEQMLQTDKEELTFLKETC